MRIEEKKIIEWYHKAKRIYSEMQGKITGREIARILKISRWYANIILLMLKLEKKIGGIEEKVNFEKDIRIGVLADLHIPYCDHFALEIALRYLEKQKIDSLILLGDIADMYQISKFDRNPERRFKYYDDREEVKGFFHFLRDRFGKIKIIYIEGNHERRLQKFLWRNAPEIASLPELHIENQFGLKEFDIEYKINPVRIGELRFIHGDEYSGSSSTINISRTIFLKSLINTLFGHWHITQEYIQKDLDGSVKGAWSVGCLSILSPEWAKLTRWNHGFAIIDFYKDGFFEVHNKKIIERRVL